jgi:hypothetical protein
MYDLFKTDKGLEREGVLVEYGAFRVKIARTGGANKRYLKRLEAALKPYRRAIQTDTMSEELAGELMRRVFAETVVLDWETAVDGEWRRGIEAPDGGELLPVTADNVAKTLEALPDLFTDLREQAGKVSLFRQTVIEGDSGN